MTTIGGPGGVDQGVEVTSAEYAAVSFWEICDFFVRRRVEIVRASIVTAALVALVVLAFPRTWSVRASFRPQSGAASAGQLSSLAAQFGVNVGAGLPAEESPAFYAVLAQSGELLRRVVADSIRLDDGSIASLASIVDVAGDSPEQTRDKLIARLLDRHIQTSVDLETGLVALRVRFRQPEVSAEVASRILAELDRFNVTSRRSRAAQERAFVAGLEQGARADLQAAESQLVQFLRTNRQYDNSPELRFEHDRLVREVMMRQQLLTSLTEAYQQARIGEVRDTPVISVVESVVRPSLPDRRRLIVKSLVGSFLGAAVAVMLLWLSELRRPADGPAGVAFDRVVAFLREVRRRGLVAVLVQAKDHSRAA